MKFNAKTELSDANYFLSFKEPWIEGATEQNRKGLVTKLSKSFLLRLNDFRVDIARPSDKLLSFTKFYGDTFVDISFGLEEIFVLVRRIQTTNHLLEILHNVYEVVKDQAFVAQRFSLYQHMSTELNANEVLESINPKTPEAFKGSLLSKGILYGIEDKDKQMAVHLSINKSFSLPNGIYFSFDCHFQPNLYDFDTASKIAKSKYELVLEAFNLSVEQS